MSFNSTWISCLSCYTIFFLSLSSSQSTHQKKKEWLKKVANGITLNPFVDRIKNAWFTTTSVDVQVHTILAFIRDKVTIERHTYSWHAHTRSPEQHMVNIVSIRKILWANDMHYECWALEIIRNDIALSSEIYLLKMLTDGVFFRIFPTASKHIPIWVNKCACGSV